MSKVLPVDASVPQVPPSSGEREVAEQVIQDMNARVAMGLKKYGTRLMTHNGRDALVDAYQEALDLAMYLKQAIMERPASREQGGPK